MKVFGLKSDKFGVEQILFTKNDLAIFLIWEVESNKS